MNRSTLAGVVLLAMAALGTQESEATPALTLSSGGQSIRIDDGSAWDLNPLAGVVVYQGSVGGFSINVTTGISSGTSSHPLLDLNSINVSTSVGGGTLQIGFSDAGFTAATSGDVGFRSLIGGTSIALPPGAGTPGSVTLNSYLGSTLFEQATSLTPGGLSGSGAFSGSLEAYQFLTAGTPYSLTEVVTLNFSGPGIASFDAALVATPEPASLLLLGTGLLGLGLLTKRRSLTTT